MAELAEVVENLRNRNGSIKSFKVSPPIFCS